MGWEARLATPITQTADVLFVSVEFYDTAAPDQILHQERLRVPLDVTRKRLREAIIRAGQEAQLVRARAETLNAAFAGTTLTIPPPDQPVNSS